MNNRLIFLLIFILASVLRFYRLGEIPPALDWDEVSLGYNAWVLGETGRDEFGNSFPLSIRSFGDYKPPVYTYLLIPVIKVFGRTEFSIRFPSAAAGTLTVLAAYFLVGVLLRSDPAERGRTFSDRAALISAFLLAISPWHLQFSRIGFEANVGLFFFVTGMWLLVRALSQRLPWSLFLSVVSMSAAMMSYHSLRIVIPLIVLAVLWIYRKSLGNLLRFNLASARLNLNARVPLILSTILTILTILTISYTIFFQNVGQSRFNETSFLTIDDLITVSRRRIEKFGGSFLDRAVNHRFLVYGRQYLKGYLDHYNFRFWFLDGDRNDRHRTPGVGLLYWWEGALLVMGLMGLMSRMSPMAAKEKAVLFLWLMAAPAAAALTGGTPSAVRSLAFLPTFQIIEGVGAVWIMSLMSLMKRGIIIFCLLFLVVFETSYYFHQYYVQAPVETAPSWQYGYKQLVSRIMNEKDNYDKVIVTTGYDQPYIYFLWYGNYDHKLWINDGEFNKRFEKYEFRKIEWDQLSDQQKVLVVSSPDETKGKPVKWQINFPDGRTAFNVTEL